MKWTPVSECRPEVGAPVLLCYTKKQGRWGKGGRFITEGVLRSREVYSWEERLYGEGAHLFYWEDYTERLLHTVGAKTTKNEVTHWTPLPPKP